jgi:hypothetical protein
LPPDVVVVDPCAEMKAKSAETVFHNKLMQLNTQTAFDANNETGFIENRNIGSTTPIYTNAPLIPNRHTLSIPESNAFTHVHTNFFTDKDGEVQTTVKML